MESKAKYSDSNDDNQFVFNMIRFIITKENAPKIHELIRELLKANAIEKLDAEMLLAAAEML